MFLFCPVLLLLEVKIIMILSGIKEERISNETCVLFSKTISIPKIDQTKKMMFAPFMVDSGCDVIIDFSYNKQVNWRDLLQ